MAQLLRDDGVVVFYDAFFSEYLWGKNLVDTLSDVYGNRSDYVVIFVSSEYADRDWTTHERQSAQAKALLRREAEYILPIRVDSTSLAGLPESVAYLSITEHTIDEIAQVLLRKLRRS